MRILFILFICLGTLLPAQAAPQTGNPGLMDHYFGRTGLAFPESNIPRRH